MEVVGKATTFSPLWSWFSVALLLSAQWNQAAIGNTGISTIIGMMALVALSVEAVEPVALGSEGWEPSPRAHMG